MAAPLKATVDLNAAPRVAGSRIRRDPPAKAKEIDLEARSEQQTRALVIGILAVSFAVATIVWGIASMNGWTPRDVTLLF